MLGLLVLVAGGLALTSQPSTLTFSRQPESGQVDLTMQTVGSYGSGNHPTWVSYLTQSPQGHWEHTTIWQVPAHTRINVTIYQYDSGSPLRNQQLGQVTGTIGNSATLNGKSFQVIDSNSGNGVGHTFSIPTLGISVPLYANDPNANLCCGGAVHEQLAAQRGQVLLHEPGAGYLFVAVLRALRTGVPVWQRGTHVHRRLHGWLHEGRVMADSDMPTERPA